MHTRQGVAEPAQSQHSPLPNPDFKPLEKLLGPLFCEDYMYMGQQTGVFLYKHIDTRRYLNIDEHGTTYRYDPATRSYLPIDRAEAIMAVFA